MRVVESFMDLVKKQSPTEFVESMLLFFGAPVLRRLRCACLVNIRRNGGNMAAVWSDMKKDFLDRCGLEAEELPLSRQREEAFRQDAVLLLLYDRMLLGHVLQCEEVFSLLRSLEYKCAPGDVDSCIAALKGRFSGEFPHEIGLFLGYPPADVRAFMRDGGRESLVTGYWKVYSNVREATLKFHMFKRAEYLAAKQVLRRSGVMQAGA